MFNSLRQNSVFYIFEKNTDKPSIKIGKVTKVNINPQTFGLANQEIDITVVVNNDNYEFKKMPANVSIVSPSDGIVIADNIEDMTKEIETTVANSQQVLNSIDYHKNIINSKDELISTLNPNYAKQREQELKLVALENKVCSMEQGIGDIKAMLSLALEKKGE